MSAKIEYRQNEIRVYLDGEIDHHSASLIRITIDEAIMARRPDRLILDFGKVTFMDSSGIGLVMGRYRMLAKTGAQLYITGASPQIYKVMKLAGIERLAKLEER